MCCSAVMGGGTVADGRAALREVHALARCLKAAAARHAEPQAELMALMWGPRFDRRHAMELLAHHPQCSALPPQTVAAWLAAAADRFDALPASAQARWRMQVRPRTLVAGRGPATMPKAQKQVL
jgi:hypothetical protein